MAGSIFWKERAVVTLNNANFAALANGTAAAAGANVDVRTAGNAAGDYAFMLEMTVQWSSVGSIAANQTVFDVYMIPALDGTNFLDVDTTSGASVIAVTHRVGSLVVGKVPTNGVDMRFATAPFTLMPALYKCYILNRSGVTTTANATVKILSAQDQYS